MSENLVTNWPLLLAGILLCLGGWFLYWASIQMAGALAGGTAGGVLGWAIAALAHPGAMLWAIPAGAAIGLFLGIFLSRKAHRLLFFAIGCGVGIWAAHHAFTWSLVAHGWPSNQTGLWRAIFFAGGAIAGGFCATRGSRLLVILATVAVGALLAVTSISSPWAVLALIPLAIFSFLVQMGAFRVLGARKPMQERD